MIRTKRTNAVLMSLMLAFILTLGAGVVVGVAAGRRTPALDRQTPATHPAESRSGWSLPEALGLNTEQREKFKAIWTETVQGPSQKAYSSKRSQLIKDRDESLYNLLTDEQKQQYQKKMTEYSAKLADLNKEREKAVQEAIERTKLMLDEKQREKYEQILKDHPFPRGDRDHLHGGGSRTHGGQGRGSPRFGEPRTQPLKGGPTTEESKDNKEPAARQSDADKWLIG